MEVLQVLHMNKGEGDSSYAKNSSVQRKIMSVGYSRIREALEELLVMMSCWKDNTGHGEESMGIADLGCSSGPNTLSVVAEIIGVVYAKSCQMCCSMPELRISLNDLPGNDFNHIFVSLPAFYANLSHHMGSYLQGCYIYGAPGTFYGRLFPKNSQHFIHSSSSLHWLSQVPQGLDNKGIGTPAPLKMNRGKIYISKTSPGFVVEAYLTQFQSDFQSFLKSRSEEMVPGGRMVLSFMGRCSPDPACEESCYQWELLARALMSMASEGLVEEEKIDSFNAPYYAPSWEEVRREIEREGSFEIKNDGVIEAFEVEWDVINKSCPESSSSSHSHGERVSKTIRAVVESMLGSHFGAHLMDELFSRFTNLVDQYYLVRTRPHYINLVVSLARKTL